MSVRGLLRRLPEPVKTSLRKLLVFRTPKRNPRTSIRTQAWDRDGYAVLPGFFEDHRIQAAARLFDESWARRKSDGLGLVIDILSGGSVQGRMRFSEAPDDCRGSIYKLNDLYLVNESVRALVLDCRLVEHLKELVGEEVVAINSLHFERGSTQGYHVDTFYMEPPPGGRLIVSSICLEDAHPDAGPLQYYPGSHLIPPFLNIDGDRKARTDQEFIDATAYLDLHVRRRDLRETQFCGNSGDTFLWHEQLYHGGSPIKDITRTRRSIVTHYWTKASMIGWDVAPSHGGYYLRREHQSVGE